MYTIYKFSIVFVFRTKRILFVVPIKLHKVHYQQTTLPASEITIFLSNELLELILILTYQLQYLTLARVNIK